MIIVVLKRWIIEQKKEWTCYHPVEVAISLAIRKRPAAITPPGGGAGVIVVLLCATTNQSRVWSSLVILFFRKKGDSLPPYMNL